MEKKKVIFFTQKKVGEEVNFKLYDKDLERVQVVKFLGMWFDKRLTWQIHIGKMIEKCRKIINIMKCVGSKEWGADRKSMKTLYIGLIKSILDYECIAYGSAAETQLKK